MVQCPKCKTVSYCTEFCQERGRVKHKFNCCIGRSLDAADDLVLHCIEGRPPEDSRVLKAFKFTDFQGINGNLFLFGIDTLLVTLCGVSDEQLRIAWKKDKLDELIVNDHQSPGTAATFHLPARLGQRT
jgi:hypothetical protein